MTISPPGSTWYSGNQQIIFRNYFDKHQLQRAGKMMKLMSIAIPPAICSAYSQNFWHTKKKEDISEIYYCVYEM